MGSLCEGKQCTAEWHLASSEVKLCLHPHSCEFTLIALHNAVRPDGHITPLGAFALSGRQLASRSQQ